MYSIYLGFPEKENKMLCHGVDDMGERHHIYI